MYQFKGQILHPSASLRPQAFAGKRVVVVGAGNSAVQIAVELSQIAQTNLAVRSKVRFTPSASGAGTSMTGLGLLTGYHWGHGSKWANLREYLTPGATVLLWRTLSPIRGSCFSGLAKMGGVGRWL